MQLAKGEEIVKEYDLVESPNGSKPRRGIPGVGVKVVLTNKRVVKTESTRKPHFSASVEIPVRHVTAIEHSHGKRRRIGLIKAGVFLVIFGIAIMGASFADIGIYPWIAGGVVIVLGILLFCLGLKFFAIISIRVISMSGSFEYEQRGLEKKLDGCAVSLMIEELPKLIVEEQAK